MANDSRSTTQHPDPARPDDPLIPNPGDPYPGHPDPAYPSADHPAQQRAESAKNVERQMTSGEGGERIDPPQTEQPQTQRRQMAAQQGRGWQPSDQKQLTDGHRGRRRARGAQQQAGQDSNRSQQQSDTSGFGDPSPGDENPRPLPPRGPQRS
jgi:hypothetical protein